MMSPDSELRIWIALDGSEVVGVLPLVAERMARQRLRLLPTATDMLYGVVPIADPDRVEEVVADIAEDFATRIEPVDMASVFWLPEHSPWRRGFADRLAGLNWVVTATSHYPSYFTSISEGMDAWLAERGGDFRREVRRRARRCEEQGFRIFTTVDPAEITQRLPRLQDFYLRRKAERGGEGYRFDDQMSKAFEDALHVSEPGRFGLSVLERDELIIGMQMVLRAGTRMSSWMTGYDPAPEWSRLGTGIATLLEALDAGTRAGFALVDLGVGDEPYKDTFQDATLPLESVTWCKPRLARMLQLATQQSPDSEDGADGRGSPGAGT
jgi:CelD/BcsL family acetyltransferase involved in cellulose biosynthesis